MVTRNDYTLDGEPYEAPGSVGELHLTVSTTYDADDNDRPYRLIITVTSAANIDENVFVYQGVPTTPGQAVGSDEMFVTVATLSHMEELPVDLPDSTYGYMYRKSSVDLVFPCPGDMEQAKTDILFRIEELLSDIENMAIMQDGLSVAFDFTTE